MLSTARNLNNVIVSEAFIDEIVENPDRYLCLSLYADLRELLSGHYDRLGHRFNRRTGEFLTDQIGAFKEFSKETDDKGGVWLVGEARIPKRNKRLCGAIQEMYDEGKLKFSFEIITGEYKTEDGIVYVDVSEKNYLHGMCVVSVPAYPQARATELVAEADGDAAMQAAFEHAQVYIAEADISTIMERIHCALWKAIEANDRIEDKWRIRFERIGLDFATLYDSNTTKTYKVEFVIEDEQVAVTDFYEIEFIRKDDENMDELKERIAELEKQLAQKESKIDELEDEMETAKCKDKEQTEAIAELTEYKTKWEQAEAEKAENARKEKVAQAKVFAESSGLDVKKQEIAAAVEALNYEMLIAEVTKARKPSAPLSPTITMASLAGDFNAKGYEDLYAAEKR